MALPEGTHLNSTYPDVKHWPSVSLLNFLYFWLEKCAENRKKLLKYKEQKKSNKKKLFNTFLQNLSHIRVPLPPNKIERPIFKHIQQQQQQTRVLIFNSQTPQCQINL